MLHPLCGLLGWACLWSQLSTLRRSTAPVDRPMDLPGRTKDTGGPVGLQVWTSPLPRSRQLQSSERSPGRSPAPPVTWGFDGASGKHGDAAQLPVRVDLHHQFASAKRRRMQSREDTQEAPAQEAGGSKEEPTPTGCEGPILELPEVPVSPEPLTKSTPATERHHPSQARNHTYILFEGLSDPEGCSFLLKDWTVFTADAILMIRKGFTLLTSL